jgi:hypothetical protein
MASTAVGQSSQETPQQPQMVQIVYASQQQQVTSSQIFQVMSPVGGSQDQLIRVASGPGGQDQLIRVASGPGGGQDQLIRVASCPGGGGQDQLIRVASGPAARQLPQHQVRILSNSQAAGSGVLLQQQQRAVVLSSPQQSQQVRIIRAPAVAGATAVSRPRLQPPESTVVVASTSSSQQNKPQLTHQQRQNRPQQQPVFSLQAPVAAATRHQRPSPPDVRTASSRVAVAQLPTVGKSQTAGSMTAGGLSAAYNNHSTPR